MEGIERVVQDRIELEADLRAPDEAAHPETIGDQDVVQRAVQTPEKHPAVGAILLVRQRLYGGVELVVGPGVVARQDVKAIRHRTSPSSAPADVASTPGNSARRAA